MMYGAEIWPARKALEKNLDVAEIKTLSGTCGVTKMDKFRNNAGCSGIGNKKTTEVQPCEEKRRILHGG